MAAITNGDGWTPAIKLDLRAAGSSAFEDVKQAFADWAKTQPPLGPVTLKNGWHTITPQISEELLRRNTGNRKAALPTVKKYWRSMLAKEWAPTGQPILLNIKGKLEDAAHRLWASYLGGVSFESYVIVDVPFREDLFAYIDDTKPRTAADALYTSGTNGMSKVLAAAIKMAGRFDDGTLDAFRDQRGVGMNTREVLAYNRLNPEFKDIAHDVISSFPQAVEIIDNKAVAVLFAWKVEEACGTDVRNEFLTALASEDLEADTPTEGFRARLLREEKMGGTLKPAHLLALLIKAFNLHVTGKRINVKKGLHLLDSEPFPQIEVPMEQAEAAE